jgi:hypothetical protein
LTRVIFSQAICERSDFFVHPRGLAAISSPVRGGVRPNVEKRQAYPNDCEERKFPDIATAVRETDTLMTDPARHL